MEEYSVEQGSIIKLLPGEYEIFNSILEKKGIRIADKNFDRDFIQLPQAYVGYIGLENRKIKIKSKMQDLELEHILRMYYLVYFNNEVDFGESIFDLTKDNTDSIIDFYINELIEVLKVGLPVEYIAEIDESEFIRGKMDINKSIMNLRKYSNTPFVCEFDNLSRNVEINQLLYTAYIKIEHLVDDSIKGFISRGFQNVSRINRISQKPIINRKIKYCEKAVLLAYMILNDLTVSGIGESKFSENLLIDIDRLFEQFVQRVLISYSGDDKFIFWDFKHKYGEYYQDKRKLEKEYAPDLLYNYRKEISKEKASCVLDMKNKTSAPFNSSDVYQMCFYATMLDSNKVILCYPSTIDTESTKLNIFNDGIKLENIYAVYINLTGDTSDEFMANLQKFTNEIFRVIDL